MIRRLAKLRQFRSGMDIEEYLTGELRQNWIAIEQTFRKLGMSLSAQSDETDTVIVPGTAVFHAVNIPSLANGTISLANSIVTDGNLTNDIYYPTTSGIYFVKFGMRSSQNTSTAQNSTISATLSTGTVAGTIFSGNATGPVLTSGNNNAIFANLSQSVGIKFVKTSSGTITLSNFYCEIIKVSDL